MNRFIIATVIGIALFAGAILAFNFNKGSDTSDKMEHNTEDTNTKPIAQSHRSYELEVTSNIDKIQPNQPTTFKFKVKNDKRELLKNYEIAHEKIMHFIAVRKDLQHFQHLHPEYDQTTGEFSIALSFPTNGVFRVFPDFTPTDENPQKLPITLNKDINVGDINKYTSQEVKADTNPTKTADGYSIAYKLNPQQPKAKSDFTYTLTVSRNGQPVTDLETYLGAQGHSVILKEGTLDFIHTHAGEANAGGAMQHGTAMENSSNKGPDINFSTSLPEPGIYKLFTQFQDKGKIVTTDYTINVN